MARKLLVVFALAALLASAAQAPPQAPPQTAQPPAPPADVVFRSDVALVRIDVQAVDRNNRAITGLHAEDFELFENGKKLHIRNFASENMPIDVLLLIDVSTSMRPNVERIASAAHEAFRVLGSDDRVGIMVFDRAVRVRMSLRSGAAEAERQMEMLLRQEDFRGGTDITRALLEAASYMQKNGRKEARRAIVIATDDQTEFDRNETKVIRALTRADAVLCALLAPDFANQTWSGGRQRPTMGGGGYPGGSGGGYPGGSRYPRRGGLQIPGIPIPSPIPGGGGRNGGGGGQMPGQGRSHTQSAGTEEIARQSGGDSMRVDDASAFEMTLSRIRQRYALHFLLPPGAKAGEERTIDVQFSAQAIRRYPTGELRYRHQYLPPSDGNTSSDAETVSDATPTSNSTSQPQSSESAPVFRRRPNVSDTGSGPRGPNPNVGSGWPRSEPSQPAATTTPTAAPSPAETPATTETKGKGWPRVKPEPPPNSPPN